jgi:hypothetical protein
MAMAFWFDIFLVWYSYKATFCVIFREMLVTIEHKQFSNGFDSYGNKFKVLKEANS